MTLRESWRLFHIMAEFVEGFENLSDLQPAITFFGSARCRKGEELYENTYDLAKMLAKNGFQYYYRRRGRRHGGSKQRGKRRRSKIGRR